jgi:hypothetical protein
VLKHRTGIALSSCRLTIGSCRLFISSSVGRRGDLSPVFDLRLSFGLLLLLPLLDQLVDGVKLQVMKHPVRVSPLPGSKIYVVFPDGVEGVIDMSSSVGRGVFSPLANPEIFAGVHLGDHGQIAWSEEMEICPDAAYRELAGQNADKALYA